MRRTQMIAAAAAVLLLTGASAASAAADGAGGKGGASAGVHSSGKGKGDAGKGGKGDGAEKGTVCKVVAGHARHAGLGDTAGGRTVARHARKGSAPGEGAGTAGAGTAGPVAGKGWQPPFEARDLAKALHISQAKAEALYAGLGKLAHGPRGTIDEGSSGFAKVAARAGVGTEQLNDVLMKLKLAAGEKECPGSKGDKHSRPDDPGKGGGSGKADGRLES